MSVRELELDLDAFEGPFDLLLTLVLREELPLAEVDVAGIVLAFVERLAEREELDLDACGEFLVLVAALLELKARGLFAGEAELEDLEPGRRPRSSRGGSRSTGGSRAPPNGWPSGSRRTATAFSGSGLLRWRRAGSGGWRSRIRRRSRHCCRPWSPSRLRCRSRISNCAFRRFRGSWSSSAPCWGGVSGSTSTTRSKG